MSANVMATPVSPATVVNMTMVGFCKCSLQMTFWEDFLFKKAKQMINLEWDEVPSHRLSFSVASVVMTHLMFVD